MKTACVYQMLFPNGKRYIGMAGNAAGRKRDHLSHARRGNKLPVYQAIRKHGAENVVFTVLLVGQQDYVLAMERRCIEAFGTVAPGGYNVSAGGDCSPASAPQAREKIRQSKLRHWEDPAYRAKISALAKAFRPNTEQRKKNAEAKKKNWADPQYRQNMVEAHKGKRHSQETRDRMSASQRLAWKKRRG